MTSVGPLETALAGWLSCPRCSRRARQGQPFCEQCGLALFDADAPRTPREQDLRSAPSRTSQACAQCGATVTFPEGQRTTSCPFCDTPYVAEGETSAGRFEPEFVLPFTVTEATARERCAAWLARGRVFAPGDLRLRAQVDPPRGVYLPFWSFSAKSASRFAAQIGEYWYETRTRTVTVNGRSVTRTERVRHTGWYPFEGGFHQYHSQYLVSGSRGFPQELADAIAPFPVAEMLRYRPQYLSGWIAEEYSVGRDEAETVSRAWFTAAEREAISAWLPGDTHDDLEVQTEYSDVTEDLLFLPVWILAFRYRERVYRYVLNGATGREWGRCPVSAPRVVAAVLLGLAVVAAIALLGWLGR